MTLLVANWKMHGTASRVREYAHAVNAALAQLPAALGVVFCPPTPYLHTARDALPQNARLGLGAQNCHAGVEGAFTGEASAPMLYDVGARYVILGHSERRSQCDETCADVRIKADSAIAAGLMPILCVGETRAEYEAGETAAVLEKQARALVGLEAGRFVVAYEPVWAIGSGKTPETGAIAAAHRAIKSALGSTTAVLYGGSVNAGNLTEILGLREVQGALIGGASLEMETMRALMAIAAKRGT